MRRCFILKGEKKQEDGVIASDSPLVLVAHVDGTLANDISQTLRAHRYKVLKACCAAEALKHCAKHHPDVILLDLFLPPTATRALPASNTKAATGLLR
ncbi:unnamed protein product, partial [marine sediment metagenome]